MPIRSQLDTSVYKGNGGNTTSFGDIMSLVSGIAGMAKASRQSKKTDKEDEDIRYINEITGKHMQGYDGQDPDELYNRRQRAYNEILSSRPELNQYVMPLQDTDMSARNTVEQNALKLQRDRATLDNDKVNLDRNKRTNEDEIQKQKFARYDAAANALSDVSDDFGYNKVLQDYSDVLGEINPYYQNYATSEDGPTKFWREHAGRVKQQKLTAAEKQILDADRKARGDEAATRYKGAQADDFYSQIKKRQWDMDNPENDPKGNRFGNLAGFNAPETLANAGEAMGHVSTLKTLIDSGDAKWWERGRGGKFLNPDFKGSFDFLSNYKGRKDSGAAINEKEWETFRNLVADRDMMMSPEGRAKVSSMLGKFLGNVYAQGVLQTKGNERWYDDYLELEKYANKNYGPPSAPEPNAIDDLQLIRIKREQLKNGR